MIFVILVKPAMRELHWVYTSKSVHKLFFCTGLFTGLTAYLKKNSVKLSVSPEGAVWGLINDLNWCDLGQCWLGLQTTTLKKIWGCGIRNKLAYQTTFMLNCPLWCNNIIGVKCSIVEKSFKRVISRIVYVGVIVLYENY